MPTQQEIADDTGLSQSVVSGALTALKLKKDDYENMPIFQIRRMIFRHFSDVSGSRGGSAQYGLAEQRARESRLKGDLLQFQIHEKAKTLVPANDTEGLWTSLVIAARTELLQLPEKLTNEIKVLYGVDVDPATIETHIHDALSRLANTEIQYDV